MENTKTDRQRWRETESEREKQMQIAKSIFYICYAQINTQISKPYSKFSHVVVWCFFCFSENYVGRNCALEMSENGIAKGDNKKYNSAKGNEHIKYTDIMRDTEDGGKLKNKNAWIYMFA